MRSDNAHFAQHEDNKGVAGDQNVCFGKNFTLMSGRCKKPVSLALISCEIAKGLMN